MRKNKNSVLMLFTTMFGAGMVVFLGLFLSYFVTLKTYKTQLENSYMKNFYEMVDSVNTLEVDLSKIVATTNLSSQRELLSNIYDTCILGVNNINVLPINNENLTQVNKLLNTTGGFAYSLLLSNYEGNLISDNDYLQITQIHDKVRELRYDINNYMQELQYDYSILDDVDFKCVEDSSFSAGFTDAESNTGNIPSLIYDGPFSDSVLNREIKGLSNTEYSQEEVYVELQNLFPEFEIEYTSVTNGKFETYNYEIEGEIDLFASVTKRGGLLLTLTAFGGGEGTTISVEEGIIKAEDFAKQIGIENMYSVWYQQSGNILYVNLAPIINHVIYYSDLIKVKIDLSLDLIVGWEATNYATNHVDRSFTSSISILQAQENINNIMTIVERNLCIIPDKFVGELSAYEFICTWEDYTYYIYIDSKTGKEVNLLRVIETSNGDLLL